ncbi:hypothetical protein AC249_AIPGENE20401 [Exaiptasia diaphana]|nr:hypothetical protein AC249_AIPGENE20401 [Exaiptasia diaphana]
MLGLYDELTHFLTQMNIYKGKTLTDSQDLAMLLQLHNGLSWTRKTEQLDLYLEEAKRNVNMNNVAELWRMAQSEIQPPVYRLDLLSYSL